MIERLERVPLREVWKHEALDFTKWLEENIDVLNEILDLNLASADREQAAGAFSVDLVAEDESGNPVVIENLLEKSDHNHLGKVITYLTAIGSKVAIWIVADPRPEHVKAIAWLNESSGADFYLLKVEAVRIGESEPAPLLTLITGPSEAVRWGRRRKNLLSDTLSETDSGQSFLQEPKRRRGYSLQSHRERRTGSARAQACTASRSTS